MAEEFLLYRATDQPAYQITDYFLSEWNNGWGDIRKYDGKHPNGSHSLDHRREYHLPVFKRELARTGTSTLVEWWIRNWRKPESDWTAWEAEPNPAYHNLIHYNPENHGMQARLEMGLDYVEEGRRERGTAPKMTLMPDLKSGLDNEIIVESVLPLNSFKHRTWELTSNDVLDLVGQMAHTGYHL